MVGIRRPVYLQGSGVGYDGSGYSYAPTPSQRPTAKPKAPNVDLTADYATQAQQAGVPGAGVQMPSDATFVSSVSGATYTPYGFTEAGTPYTYGRFWDPDAPAQFFKVKDAPVTPPVTAGPAGPTGPSRQELIDAAFAGLPSRDVYTGDADFAALADYYTRGRQQLEDVYGSATGRIGTTTAETLAALQALDPQAAFVYDVGAPNIPGVNVDYLRALGASADPVSAEAEFARNILGYQLAASQRAAEGMGASLERERQARQAASQLMQQEGLRQAAAARAQALAQIAARQAAEEAIVRERVRAAQEAEADRQQELDMLRLELQLAGIE
jgi:hypothetical protein